MHWEAQLIDLLDSWATCGTTTCGTTHVWHAATRHTISTTTSGLVDLHHDWIDNALNFFLLGLEFILLSQLVLVEPVQGFLDCLLNLVFVICLKFILQLLLLQSVAHGETVVLKTILGFNFLLVGLIFSAILLCLLDHAVNLGLRQTTLLVGDGDLVRLSSGLVLCTDIQDTIGIDVECHLNLRHTT